MGPRLLLCFGLLLSCSVTSGKHILVVSGVMKSHALSMYPVVESLAANGHRVTFALPAMPEARDWFKSLPEGAKIMHVGDPTWSLDALNPGDTKNMAWIDVLKFYAEALYNYRDLIDKPLFSMYPHIRDFLADAKPDAVVLSFIAFGALEAAAASGIASVVYVHLPAGPIWVAPLATDAAGEQLFCRYPYYKTAPAVSSLKSSLAARLKNHLTCSLEMALMPLLDREVGHIQREQLWPV